jgi:hypothetical protein
MSNTTPSKSLWSKLAGFLGSASGAAASGEAALHADGNSASASVRKTIPIAVDTPQAANGFTCPPSCWGTCCDDTVFLEPRDVVAIHEFADRHFARFAAHFAQQHVLVGLHQDGLAIMRAFITRGGVSRFLFFRNAVESELLGPPPHEERRSNLTGQPYYHTLLQYDHTAGKVAGCVFLTERHTCFLEDAAIEAGEHRWTAKPEGCVLFPIVPTPTGLMKPLASPENGAPDSPNYGLLEMYRERECCTKVTPENVVRQMSEAIAFATQARASRTQALEHLQKTKMVELRKGFLQVFDRPVAGTANPRRRL